MEKMKKIISLLFIAFTAMNVSAQFENMFEVNGISYEKTSINTVGVTIKMEQYTGDIVIPNTIEYNSTIYSVTSILGWAFNWCESITSITMPNSIITIGQEAFSGCTSLPSITIPNSVTTIGKAAFAYCTSFTSIDIPSSVTSIGDGAFSDCENLIFINIPNSVGSIGGYAFRYCTSLPSITIPNSITSIGLMTFLGCTSLTEITCNTIIPPSLGENVFDLVPTGITLYVPAESVDAYKAANIWKDFNVLAILEVNAGEDQTICSGVSTSLTATGATSYVWSTGDSTATINVSPSINTTYSVTGTEGSTTAVDNVIVTVIASGMAIDSFNTTGRVTCNGSADGFGRVIMEGNNEDYTYSWSNGVMLDTIAGLSGGTYTVTVTDTNSCILIDSMILFEPNYFAEANNLSYKDKADKSIMIVWNKTPNVSSYFARMIKISDNTVRYLDINPLDTSLLISYLEPNTEYEFMIRQFENENTYSCVASLNFTTAIENTCIVTSGLNVNNISTITAKLNWNNDSLANSYMVRWRIKSPQGAWAYYNATAEQTSILVGNLTANTEYEWQIRKFCKGGFYSDFSALVGSEFTTNDVETCIEATPINVSDIERNSVSLNWTNVANSNEYMVRWRVKSPQGAWRYYNANSEETTVNATDLKANTEYEWQMRTLCNNNVSAFTALNSFTTLPNCPEILNLREDIGTTYTVLKWDIAEGANHYLLRWRLKGGDWKYININKQADRQQIGCSNCNEIDKLLANTSYEWQIRAFCDAEGTLYSNFTAIKGFSTLNGKSNKEENTDKLSILKRSSPYGNSQLSINIYPNPTASDLHIDIKGNKSNTNFELINIQGQTISKGNFVGNTTLQTKELDAGVYFIKFINEAQSVEMIKFIKQ